MVCARVRLDHRSELVGPPMRLIDTHTPRANEVIFYTIMAGAIGIFLTGCLLFKAAKLARDNAAPVPSISAGQMGREILQSPAHPNLTPGVFK